MFLVSDNFLVLAYPEHPCSELYSVSRISTHDSRFFCSAPIRVIR